jgi:hypothetical protein
LFSLFTVAEKRGKDMRLKAETIATLLCAFLFNCLAFASPVVEADSPRQRLYVDPRDNEFFNETTPVGSTFIVSVKSADWKPPGVYGYQFVLCYNNTLLEAVSAEYPEDHWLKPSIPILTGTIFDGPMKPVIDQPRGCVTAAFSLLSPDVARTGGGTLITVTFKIIQAPTEGNLSCTLEIRDVIMVDPTTGQAIPPNQYDAANGNYLLSTTDPPFAKEDLNEDGRVNILDMFQVMFAYNSRPCDARWNPKADVNGDGLINILDVVQIAMAWTW